MGFDHQPQHRQTCIPGCSLPETAEHFVVSADLALFVKYRVGLQEGPALCLKRLSADLEVLRQLPHELTSGDLAAQASAQAAAAERKNKRKRRAFQGSTNWAA